ncbi:PIN-like domain-containing protein [Cronobacter dublinensis]
MKLKFPGFYSVPEDSLKEIWLSEATIFIFDTNCLLNLYRCEDSTREQILDVMRAISSNIWLPFQVALEYQRNRRIAIEDSLASLKKIKTELEKTHSRDILGSVKKHLNKSLNDDIQQLQKNLKSTIDDFINDKILLRIENKEMISQHDFIRESIDEIIKDNIGSIPSQQTIDDINQEGEKRYTNKIPPDFSDSVKNGTIHFCSVEFQNKFGDLYLWKEIIDKAKEDNIKNVIFITDDNKEDWWFKHSGKTHGPLESLKTEICTIANINNFKLMNQLTFLEEAQIYLNDIKVSDESLQDVKELTNVTLEDEQFNSYTENGKIYFSSGYNDGVNEFNNNLKIKRSPIDDIDFDLLKNSDVLYSQIAAYTSIFKTLNSSVLNSAARIKNLIKDNPNHPFIDEFHECLDHLREDRIQALLPYKKLAAVYQNTLPSDFKDHSELIATLEELKHACVSLEKSSAYAKALLSFELKSGI